MPIEINKAGDVSKVITLIAILLWFMSLGFVAISTYSKANDLTGLHILTMGWLGPLALNFSWFANITFAISASKILSNQPAKKLVIITIVLAVNTATFSRIPLNEGGAAAAVYGYGWGFVFWASAILLIWAASRVKELELLKDTVTSSEILKSTYPLIVFLFAVLLLSVHDHISASTTEVARLERTVFKRTKICEAEIARPTMKLSPTTPLEVIDIGEGSIHLFEDPKYLLEMGVSSVRKSIFEYRLNKENGKVERMPFSSEAAAVLQVQQGPDKRWSGKVEVSNVPGGLNGLDYRITLFAPDKMTVIFDQVWRHEMDYRYCPAYGETVEQPKELILESLGLL